MILDARCIDEVKSIVTEGDFYAVKHSQLFAALVKCNADGKPGDMVHLNEHLRDTGILDKIGGVDFLIELGESVPSSSSAEHYARIVADKSKLRRLMDFAGTTIKDAYQWAEPADKLVERLERQVFGLHKGAGTQNVKQIGQVLRDVFDQTIERKNGTTAYGLSTGYLELDEFLGGLKGGQLVIVAARPSIGKTALAMNILMNLADNDIPTALLSIEMGPHELGQRVMAMRSGVDGKRIKIAKWLTTDELADMSMVPPRYEKAAMWIVDTPSLGVAQMRTIARRMIAKHGIQCLAIDYLQLMKSSVQGGRVEQVTELSGACKQLARELNIPVICLSQLRRKDLKGNPSAEDMRPELHELRDSGSIEQDADTVLLLHRNEFYESQKPMYTKLSELEYADIIVAKQRSGPVGSFQLAFHAPTTTFRNKA